MTESYVAFSPDSSWAGRVPTSYVWNPESGRYEVFWRPDKPHKKDGLPVNAHERS